MASARTLLRTTLALGLVATAGAARASGDASCHPPWKPVLYTPDCANTAAIAPANDSRVNLLLLRAGAMTPVRPYPRFEWEDRQLGRSFFTWPMLRQVYGPPPAPVAATDDPSRTGSRCDSAASGAADFHAALIADRQLAAPERDLLDRARTGLNGGCNGTARPLRTDWPTGLGSAAAKAFVGYLQAADAFYAGDWRSARSGFAALAGSRQPWVAEASTYMAIRVELNAAQDGAFDQYGSYDQAKVDTTAAGRGAAAIAAYLKRYPHGRYAGSAQGLARRAAWLGNDLAGLSRAYDRLLAATPAATDAGIALIEEIDNKLLLSKDAGPAIASPLLLATHDLLRMRPVDVRDIPRLGPAELAAQQPRFAARPDLYAYLLATAAFYVEHDPARTLALTATRARGTGPDALGFGATMLRGLALAQRRDPGEAAFWQAGLEGARAPYQRPLVELALAIALEQRGAIDAIFAPASPVTDPTIREILLRKVAGPDLLRRVAGNAALDRHQHDVALFSLLDGDLTHGHFADFGRDRALIPADADAKGLLGTFPLDDRVPVGLFAAGTWSDGFPCGALAQTAAKLAASPADAPARLCLGDFWRLNGFDRLGGEDYADPASKDGGPALGSSPSRFTGGTITRASLYAPIVADPRAASEVRAYALFRSVMCYAPSGINDCGGADVDKAQRKAWFDGLKRDYPQSRWARDLRYYW